MVPALSATVYINGMAIAPARAEFDGVGVDAPQVFGELTAGTHSAEVV